MRTCGKCGVEIEETVDRCPLCGTPLAEGPAGGAAAAHADEQKAAEPPVPESKVWRWLWEVISLMALTAAGIFFAIDLADGFRVTWSLYPLSAVGFLWTCATAVITLRRHSLPLFASLVAAVVAFLFVLSLITTGRPWFLQLALPLVVVVVAVSAATWASVRRLRLPVLPALAAAMLGSGLTTVGIEYILNRYLRLDKIVSWSLVAMACAISLFLALLLVHRRLKERHADIRRFFHL